jgi:hypothetical protein
MVYGSAPSAREGGAVTPANEYTMSELVWLVTHGTQTTRERASAELDRRFPNAAAQPEPPGWRTIESAPRDGTRVLAACRLPSRPFVVEIAKWNCDNEDPAWISWYGTKIVQPEMWMTLPEVPR